MASGMKVSKTLIGDTPRKCARFLLGLDRIHARLMVGLLTGHGTTKHMWFKIRSCRYCGEEEETSIHIICQCPAIAGIRREALGLEYLAPSEVKGIELSKILTLAIKVRLLS